MDQKTPSDALTTPPRRARAAIIGASSLALVAALGFGGVAIAQNFNQPVAEETVEPAAEVTPTPEPTLNAEPTANIATSISDLTVAVDGSGSTDSDGEVVAYAWDFGDGGTGSLPSGAHVYGASGTYTITLTVTDPEGVSSSTTTTVTVTAPPVAPPSSGGYTYGNYPPGAPIPRVPGTEQPDTGACASSTGTVDGNGNQVCA